MFLFIGITILVGTKWVLCLGRIIAYALNWMSNGFVKYFFRTSFLEQFAQFAFLCTQSSRRTWMSD